jgi:phosphate/sulfate permease
MDLFGETLPIATLLALAIGLALGFEFVNGFHDSANAVATVIYTQTLPPAIAVIWSGIWNLVGVLTASGTVAFSILALLPADLVLQVGSATGFAMIFSLLVSAILWNLGTWYLGLPASSSHTLVGAILGVGLAHSLMSAQAFGAGVNWVKAEEVFVALLVSPAIGFCGAALLLLLLKTVLPQPALYQAPEPDQPPPLWIRSLLILTCTGVSFAHGSNDGQKGMGLILLILVGILPGRFALNLAATSETAPPIPLWVKLAVAIALGLGTMIGWKRIVVTVGEKIGKDPLSYAQGVAAEAVAMATILAAGAIGLPVSTTHVLSSGVAGTMAANRSGLQFGTLRNLLTAWVLTLPVCALLSAAIFSALQFFLHVARCAT